MSFWQLFSSYMYVEKRRSYEKFFRLTLMKLTTGVNFTNVYKQLLLSKISKVQNNTDDLTVFLRFWDLYVQKLCLNMLLKMTPGVVHTS